MATSETVLAAPKSSGRPGIVSWITTVAVLFYIAWAGTTLFNTTRTFGDMFASMQVQLPLATAFVVGNYRWFYPFIFGGAAVFVVAKQFFVRQKWVRLGFTAAVALSVYLVSWEVVIALYAPLEAISEKLSK
jgi:hypothetical protein